MHKTKSGFTLVELLVVVLIIGILATISIASYSAMQARGRDSRRTTDVANLTKALELYYDDTGAFPVPGNAGSSLGNNWYSTNGTNWQAFGTLLTTTNSSGLQAIDAMPIDPQNKGYVGEVPTTGKSGYAYYTGTECGAPGQWYAIVYRLEAGTKTKGSDGPCPANYGDSLFASGASYYRVVK